MKIIRHTARDMPRPCRAVREQLGEARSFCPLPPHQRRCLKSPPLSTLMRRHSKRVALPAPLPRRTASRQGATAAGPGEDHRRQRRFPRRRAATSTAARSLGSLSPTALG